MCRRAHLQPARTGVPVCTEGGHYILQTLDNLFFYFGEVPDTNSEVPLQRIENALGHFLHFGFRSSMMERAAKLEVELQEMISGFF